MTVFFLLLLIEAVFIYLLFLEFKKYNIAKLIIENKIFEIKVAEMTGKTEEIIEYIVSCFGILLGGKLIKYNIDGIKLQEINITRDKVTFIYGENMKYEKLTLLHGISDVERIQEIARRFQYEAGIASNITGFY